MAQADADDTLQLEASLTGVLTRSARMSRTWQVQDAKARFSELLDLCQSEGPQLVTKRGLETAVLVPVAEWRRMQQDGRPTLKEMQLSDYARGDFDVPDRGQP